MKVLPYNCLIILSAIIATLGSCGRSGSEIASIVEERDSLRNISEKQTRRLANLDTLILAINEGLDTIARGEAGIFINGVTEGVNTKDEIFANINRLSQVIEQQRKQLDKFEKHLIEDEEEHGKKTGISFCRRRIFRREPRLQLQLMISTDFSTNHNINFLNF